MGYLGAQRSPEAGGQLGGEHETLLQRVSVCQTRFPSAQAASVYISTVREIIPENAHTPPDKGFLQPLAPPQTQVPAFAKMADVRVPVP